MFAADLVLVGFGNVGRRFVRLLDERAAELGGDLGIDWRVIAISTLRHGAACDLRGIETARALELVERGESLAGIDVPQARRLAPHARPPSREALRRATPEPGRGGTVVPRRSPAASSAEWIEDVVGAARAAGSSRQLVVVETTVLDIDAGQPAIDHVRAGLRAGAHVITANKGPAAFAYDELAAQARSAGRAFRFEGAVMDGIPVFNLVDTTLPVVRISGFSGVVNSTTNFIITAMENGREFGESLAEMQAAGIAEADASLDVDGWDAAAKASVLANVLMGAGTTPQQVERSGIGHLTGGAVRTAAARGSRLRLVARGRREAGGVAVKVSVETLPATHLFASLDGQQNALVLETDLLGELAIVQQGGGLTQTAYALVSDLVAVSRSHGR